MSDKSIRSNTVIRLMHVPTGKYLTALADKYSGTSTSMVVATEQNSQMTYWKVALTEGESSNGHTIENGKRLRLLHFPTKCALAAFDRPSHLPNPQKEIQREVTIAETGSDPNGFDIWEIELESESVWVSGSQFKLKHQKTKQTLHSHTEGQFPEGQEVTCFLKRDRNDLWLAEIVPVPVEPYQYAIEKIQGNMNARVLDLSNIRLEQLPVEVSGMQQLVELDLRGNLLKDLPSELAKLKMFNRLQLHLDGNPLAPGLLKAHHTGKNALRSYLTSPRLSTDAPIADTPYHYTKEACRGEECLNISNYITVLKRLLEGTVGEFCLAIFGHWGRGKSFLMKRVVEELPGSCASVNFSAWKYPTAPELWVHLYTSFHRRLVEDGWVAAVPRFARAAVLRKGMGPVYGLILSFCVTILPFNRVLDLANAAKVLISLLGIVGFIFAAKFLIGTYRIVQTLRSLIALPDHRHHLGFQATIGEDLGAMIKSWAYPKQLAKQLGAKPSRLRKLQQLLQDRLISDLRQSLGRIAIYVFLCAIPVAILFPYSEAPITMFGYELLQKPWVSWILIGIWIGAAVCLPIWFISGGRGTERLLLVVDDLDRCSPSQTITLIESLKLFVEDAEIGEKVQVVVLVEEAALRAATLQKYSLLLEPIRGAKAAYSRTRIWRETLEKLFVAHIRLSKLNGDEAFEVMEKYVGAERRRVTKVTASNPQESTEDRTGGEAPVMLRNDTDTMGTKPMIPIVEDKSNLILPLTVADENALKDVAPRLVRSRYGIPCGPRTIRNFMCRYLIAKLLLREAGARVSPQELAETLADTAGFRSADGMQKIPVESLVIQVCKQVS